ncbi:calcium-activated potassium channel subunit beta-4 isoform X3 [Vulpes lagopus]|uniref:calcium-activated potassium channel subunit beta-4 isoform X3 n=1 Tax=Vulpes lagopus TaxID=494514 RepID=UPI001BCA49C7|nr:calcium-activated potassium channel subunit beta-4 isoform X3 [Vulpes lagopus]
MAKLRVAYEYTEAEDKSIRLGLFLIISGVVSLFIFGFCWLSPALQDLQATAANCTVLSVQQLGELFECTFTCGADCRGTALYPCVQVYVNNSESHSRALLHSDEHQLLANPKKVISCMFRRQVLQTTAKVIWVIMILEIGKCCFCQRKTKKGQNCMKFLQGEHSLSSDQRRRV